MIAGIELGGTKTVVAIGDGEAELIEEFRSVKGQVGFTHADAKVLRAADTLARLLFRIRGGLTLGEAIRREAGDWISGNKA